MLMYSFTDGCTIYRSRVLSLSRSFSRGFASAAGVVARVTYVPPELGFLDKCIERNDVRAFIACGLGSGAARQ